MADPFTIAAIAGGVGKIGGALASSKRSKFRTPQLPSLSQLTSEATGAQRDALNQISDIFERGAPTRFLQNQIQSQREAVPEFAEFQRGALETGRGLLSQLVGGDLSQRLTQQGIRGAQAARGLSLGPAAAIEEGLAVARANRENQLAAINLGGSLAQLSAATPFGVEAFRPGIPSVTQNIGFGLQRAGQQAGLQAQQQAFKMQQSDAAQAARGS